MIYKTNWFLLPFHFQTLSNAPLSAALLETKIPFNTGTKRRAIEILAGSPIFFWLKMIWKPTRLFFQNVDILTAINILHVFCIASLQQNITIFEKESFWEYFYFDNALQIFHSSVNVWLTSRFTVQHERPKSFNEPITQRCAPDGPNALRTFSVAARTLTGMICILIYGCKYSALLMK